LELTVPSLVSHDIFARFARMPATVVQPLLPPRPISMRPVLGTLRCVRIVSFSIFGVTFVPSTSVV
jgi:hypothetical protein